MPAQLCRESSSLSVSTRRRESAQFVQRTLGTLRESLGRRQPASGRGHACCFLTKVDPIFWHGNFRPHRTRCVDAGYCYPRVWCSVVCICALDTSTSCAKTDERIVSRFGEQTHKIQRRCGLLLNYFGCLFYFSGSWVSFVGIMLRNSPSSFRTAFTTM